MSEFTTVEQLQDYISTNGAVLRYGEHLILTDMNSRGLYRAEIYEFIDSWKDWNIEARVNLLEKHPAFDDAGHAVEWAIRRIQEGIEL